ncbi:hypothetical protein BJX68DRAFT_268274 [Aspergillus pseudodeflectus]|uniref:Beta/gamma crystallin 'Greek key' domain-containing protein n=1 Tax=Aspergillus pseudodeflectus TaxID=176178 RepID=A0ABR4K5N4_9EURO
MKLNLALVTAIVALAPAASAWRVRFYEDKDFKGRQHTRAGPGNPGSACQGAPNPINNEISSFKFWPENAEGTSSCCLQLFNSLDCEPSSLLSYPLNCKYSEYSDLQYTPLQDKISSYRTVCRRI